MTSVRVLPHIPAMRHIFLLVTAVGVLMSCSQKRAPESSGPVTVTVAAVQSENVTLTRTWVGLLNGFQNAEVRAQVTGYLLTQDYKEGATVGAGEVLFTIDPRPFEAVLAQAQADLLQKEAQARLAQITLDRQTQLFKTQVISQQEFDTFTTNAQAAAAAAQAAQANVQAAQVNLNYCTIRAPFAGVVGKAQAQIGDLVGPGGSATVLTQISQLDPIKAIFSITESEYLQAAPLISHLMAMDRSARKAEVTITLADGDVYPHKGYFDFVNRQINTATGSIQVETLFPNPDNLLRPGLFARVTAPVQVLEGALVVPQQSVAEQQGSHFVVVVDAQNRVAVVPVEVVTAHGAGLVVQGSLKAGDQVVVDGIEKMRPGMVVNPQSLKAETKPVPAPEEATPEKAAPSS